MKKYRMILEHTQNVDLMHGQGNGTGYWSAPATPRDTRTMLDVDSLEDAAKQFRAWINSNGLGSGNLTMAAGMVCESINGMPCAQIAFNGRIFSQHAFGDPERREWDTHNQSWVPVRKWNEV